LLDNGSGVTTAGTDVTAGAGVTATAGSVTGGSTAGGDGSLTWAGRGAAAQNSVRLAGVQSSSC
jgi:hypothetical protein